MGFLCLGRTEIGRSISPGGMASNIIWGFSKGMTISNGGYSQNQTIWDGLPLWRRKRDYF